ncbi:actin binding protein [Pelomyxa schiedti]|nr:actin binding protein [Pelomyxa schiedti]
MSKIIVDSQLCSGALHSYSQEEKAGIVEHLNAALKDDEEFKRVKLQFGKMPINPANEEIFEALRDGVILCKFINTLTPPGKPPLCAGYICRPNMTVFQMHENNQKVIDAAKTLGVTLTNIGAIDLDAGTSPHIVLGLLWQLVALDLRRRVRETVRKQTVAEAKPGSDVPNDASVLNASIEEVLLKWVNAHLERSPYSVPPLTNFDSDLKDSSKYLVLLHQLEPQKCALDALNEGDALARAGLMLGEADKIGCKRFLNPEDVCKGNSRMNFAFLANLFSKYPFQPQPEAPPAYSTLTPAVRQVASSENAGHDEQERLHRQQEVEQQRLMQEQAEQQKLMMEQQRLMQEQAEQQRLMQQQAEQQRLMQQQQAEQQRQMQLQADQQRQMQQQAEQQRQMQQQAEQQRLMQQQQQQQAEQQRQMQQQAEQQRLMQQQQQQQAEQQRQMQLAEQQRLMNEQAMRDQQSMMQRSVAMNSGITINNNAALQGSSIPLNNMNPGMSMGVPMGPNMTPGMGMPMAMPGMGYGGNPMMMGGMPAAPPPPMMMGGMPAAPPPMMMGGGMMMGGYPAAPPPMMGGGMMMGGYPGGDGGGALYGGFAAMATGMMYMSKKGKMKTHPPKKY